MFSSGDNRKYHVEHATFIDQGFARGFLLIQDVTSELLTAEKDAYGKVIRMMAHEVNNTTAAVKSVLTSLYEEAENDGNQLPALTREFLPPLLRRTTNMTAFMQKFARVARLPPPAKKRLDLNDLLGTTCELMTPRLAEDDIVLRCELPSTPIFVNADAAQLEQVVVNALTNAWQSIGRGGQVVVEATQNPAGFVVADNGPGIAPEHADQLFTAFFSTKTTGQGIGLTLTREILEAHGARYQLRTETDGWTRLRVRFSGGGIST